MIELRIGGRVVDYGPNTKITLELNSNAFGDISKIVASNSFTIRLPKTPTNNNIFGSPAVLGGTSSAPYRRWDAQLYVNGVSIVDTAFAMLLSVGEEYEIVLYWGVISALAGLKDNDKSIADINEVLYTQYGGEQWWTDWAGVYGKDANGVVNNGLVNALYNPGIDDFRNVATAREQAALLPSVRARWVWDRILADSGLEIVAPSDFLAWLNIIALPFREHTIKTAMPQSFVFEKENYREVARVGDSSITDAVSTFWKPTTSVVTNPYFELKTQTVRILAGDGGNMGERRVKVDATVYKALSAHSVRFTANIVGRTYDSSTAHLHLVRFNEEGDEIENIFQHLTKSWIFGAQNFITPTTFEPIDVEEGDYVVIYAHAHGIVSAGMSVDSAMWKASPIEETKDQVFGGQINTRDNLPDIKQVDFIKAMCEMYGLWATLVDGKVHLVNYADYYNNAQPTLDWSRKLVGTRDGDAVTTTYTLLDFAQRNTLRYKEDDSVKIDASGVLYVNNETLENEKEMVELPFAASDGDEIPHLRWKDNDRTTAEVEEETVEQRIMLLREGMGADGKSNTSLSFVGLSFDALARERYAYWQRVMRNPIVIEEKMQLSEVDIKMLDFRKPIYLQKYGARFVVDKVQWEEGEPSTVTLVMLPPAKEIATALPYKVTTGVTLGSAISGAVEPTPAWAYLVSGGGDYFAKSATLYFDNAAANSKHGIAFRSWTTEAGIVLSTDNPYIYDGSNGDMTIYANTVDSFS